MGVFLRFGEGSRLVDVLPVGSGNYGNTPPINWFRTMPGDYVMEVHPECLKQLRPGTLAKLRNHCVLLVAKNGVHSLHVDSLEMIHARGGSLPAPLAELAGKVIPLL